MDVQTLSSWVNEPQTHRQIVGDYMGAYALGVQGSPPAFVLRVEASDGGRFPLRVQLHGVEVPVVVSTGFVAPRPIAG